MNVFALIGPALRLVSRGVGKLAAKSDENPKTSSFLTVFGVLAGYVGVDPGSLASVGRVLIQIGELLQRAGATQ